MSPAPADCRLYAILDFSALEGKDLEETARALLEGGVQMLQYRDKAASDKAFENRARRLLEICRAGKVPLILNDRIDTALKIGAQGAHLGAADLPLEEARRKSPAGFILGATCKTLEQCRRANETGADYIGMGAVFASATKPQAVPVDRAVLLRAVQEEKAPVFAIGGIGEENLGALLEAGVRRVCVCGALLGAPDPRAAAGKIRAMIEETNDGRRR